MQIKFYYQIDFIDDAGLANYIDTFKYHEIDKAQEHYRILSNALLHTKGTEHNMRYVLDLYAYIEDDNGNAVDDSDILIAQILPKKELKV